MIDEQTKNGNVEEPFSVTEDFLLHAEDIPIHYHEFYEIHYSTLGQLGYRIESSMYKLLPGSLLCIPPFFPHKPQAIAGDSYREILIRIAPSFIDNLVSRGVDVTKCFKKQAPVYNLSPDYYPVASKLLRKLLEEYNSTEFGNEIYAEGLLMEVLIIINRISETASDIRIKGQADSALVSKAIEFINQKYAEDITLESLAQSLFVSKFYLSHSFKDAVGISIHKYITMKRLLIAKQLLLKGNMPKDVANQCGFKDYSSFYKAFHSEFGIRPKDVCADLERQSERDDMGG